MLKNGWRFQRRNHQLQFLLNTTNPITIPRCSNCVRRLATTTSNWNQYSHPQSSRSTIDDESFSSFNKSYFRDGNDSNQGQGGTRERRGQRQNSRTRNRNSNPSSSFQKRPSTPVNFASPSKLSKQEIDRRLHDSIRTFYNETSTHLSTRLTSFGLKGEAIRWLLAAIQHSTSKNSRNQSKGKGLSSWKREMKDREVLSDSEVIARLARSWSRLALDQLHQVNDRTTSNGDGFAPVARWDYDSISDFLIYEGDSSLPRIVISEFLAWIQKELITFKRGKLNFKPQSQPTIRSMNDSSDFTNKELESLLSSQEDSSRTYSSIFYFKAPPEPLDSETISSLSSSATSSLSDLSTIISASDLSHPALMFSEARVLTRKIHLHVGPTNSGKTHAALVALTKAKTGIFAGPLRLLAHEVYERINNGTVSPGVAARSCNLLTGEEQRIVDRLAGVVACTVEMAPLDSNVEVAVIDEIQMIGDSQRGASWTNAVLGIAAKELHLCGEPSVIPLIQNLAKSCGDDLEIHQYQRLTPLEIAEKSLEGKLENVKKGDCVVTFSRSGIFAVKAKIERETGLKCAVVYGGLPPETKSEQARLFNEVGNQWDVMVASDAVGMGLNLKIKRVVFETVSKWNGSEQVFLSSSQIKQIAGRAGRFGTSETSSESGSNAEDVGGIATTLHEEDLEVLRKAMEAPMVPVARAAIQPSFEILERISVTIPPESTLSNDQISPLSLHRPPSKNAKSQQLLSPAHTLQPDSSISSIYANVSLLTKIDPKNYFLSDFTQQHSLSPLVERAARSLPFPTPTSKSKSDSHQESTLSAKDQLKLSLAKPIPTTKMQIPSLLSLNERETLSNAPADVKNPLVVTWYHGAIKNLAEGRLVDFEETEDEMGIAMTKVLEEVEELQRFKKKRKAVDSQGNEVDEEINPTSNEVEESIREGEEPTSQTSSSSNKEEVQASVSAITLSTLESLHRSLSLYLWLSFRFPLSFCYRFKVEALKKRTELAIEWGLEDMRNSRKDRLRILGRGPEDEKRRREDKRKRRGRS